MALKKGNRQNTRLILTVMCFFMIPFFYTPSPAFAACYSCACDTCPPIIIAAHKGMQQNVSSLLQEHRNQYLAGEYLYNSQILDAMMLMTEQLTAVGVQQIQIIGTFFDAKHQLETQRLFQTLVAQAHKDYHPSEGLCEIGTGVRALAASQRHADLGKVAFANRVMQRQLLSQDTLSGRGERSDRLSRLTQFRTVYCNPTDNADSLALLCGTGGIQEQYNMDVNYTDSIENRLTLDINLLEQPNTPTPDQQNVFALNANIFGNQVLNLVKKRSLADLNHKPHKLANFYYKQRAIAAKRSVAQNSFAAITAMRSSGNPATGPFIENAAFLRSIIQELGVQTAQINDYIGENPSYFAQMEILTKKIYQNPKFYANLYDKPANIERKGAALQAIALMQDRDIYKSLLRSEAVLSTLLETLMSDEHTRISRDLTLNDQGERH